MVQISQILCPVDLSDVSARALQHALAVARWSDAAVTVMEVTWTALPPSAYAAASPIGSALLPADREELLVRLRAFTDAATPTGVRLDTIVREGSIVPQILQEADARHADLIVMGTHGHTGFDRLVLGSVTEKVLRKAHCPVLTVPPAAPGPGPSAQDAPFRTILSAMDFSPSSFAALNLALSLAQRAEARLVQLHVLDWPTDRGTPPGHGPEVGADRRREREASLRELRMAVPDAARDWCTPEEVVRIGRPHEEIVRLAHELPADLIVIGVHGRAVLSRPFVGSTTDQVVRHAACPVLTVR
jgi:nucleotide-binding universal stress UspA family protein